MRILITGGAGFIGSNLIHHWLKAHPQDQVINFDCLSYAGNLINLQSVENHPNYRFIKGDLTHKDDLKRFFEENTIDGVIHLAAESHVDRSIFGPDAFVQSNIVGTFNLLEAVRHAWKGEFDKHRYLQVSTDEVYGSLGESGLFSETTPYAPNSPYSASKAAADHLVRAYHHTYGLDVVVTNCSNNYGPYQFPEKLLPLLIKNCLESKPIPVYGDGSNVRDWLYVGDHCHAISLAFYQGKSGQHYNVGGMNEWKNLDIVRHVCQRLDQKLGRSQQDSCANLITFVKDRPGHDKRYAIDASKIIGELGWKPDHSFEQGLEETIDWYLSNQEWVRQVTSGEYQNYYDQQYVQR